MKQLALFAETPAVNQWADVGELALALARAFAALSDEAEPALDSARWPVRVGDRRLVVKIEDSTAVGDGTPE